MIKRNRRKWKERKGSRLERVAFCRLQNRRDWLLCARYILNVAWRKLFQKDRKCARVHDRAKTKYNSQSFVECATIYSLFSQIGARVYPKLFRANDRADPFTENILRKGACTSFFVLGRNSAFLRPFTLECDRSSKRKEYFTSYGGN